MSSWSTAKPKVGGGNDTLKLEDYADIYEYQDSFDKVRPIGPVSSFVRFWIVIKIKNKEGKSQLISVPRICTDYNPITEEFEPKTIKNSTGKKIKQICPYRKAYESGKYNFKVKVGKYDNTAIRMEKRYLSNFLVRSLQEDEPRKKPKQLKSELKKTTQLEYTGYFKEPKSKSWTPIRLAVIPQSLAVSFKSITELNTRGPKGKKKCYDISHPKFGRDVSIKYNEKAAAANKYEAQGGDASELTEEETGYLLQPLNNPALVPKKYKEAVEDWEKLAPQIVKNPEGSESDDEDESEDLDDEDEKPKKKKKSTSSKTVEKSKSKKSKQDDDDDLEDDLDDIDLDDEDEKPKKKKKSTSSKKKRK